MNAHFQRASMLMEQARYSLAEDELRQALTQDPDNGLAHAMLGLCLSNLNRFNDAQQEAETAIHLEPDQPFVFYAYASVLLGRNDFKKAKSAVETAIGMDPFSQHHFAMLARIEFQLHNWQAAADAADSGLSLDPEDVECTNLRAMALVKLGKTIDAQETLKTALKRSPEDPFSHANLGWSLLENGEPQKAMEHFREALRLDPEMEWARSGIIEAMKARYFIYRIMLSWFLWMAKLQQKAQFGVIIFAYIGYQILNGIAANNPGLAPWINPFLIVYVAFALMTWLAVPLFNLVLRTNKFGRLALSDEQIRTSTWVGLCVVGSVGMLIAYFFAGSFEFLGCALAFALIIPPISRVYNCSEGWPRSTLALISIAMGIWGAIISTCLIVALLSDERLRIPLMECADSFFLPFVYASIAVQFGTQYFATVQPRLGTDHGQQVWRYGLVAIAIVGLSMVAFVIYTVASPLKPYPPLFTMPITLRPIAAEDIVWADPEQLEKRTKLCADLGFRFQGDYRFDGWEGNHVRVALSKDRSTLVELTEYVGEPSHVSFTTFYENGNVFTVRNGSVIEMETRPKKTIEAYDLPTVELYETFLAVRPKDAKHRTLDEEKIEELLVTEYDAQLRFLLSRGGLSASEFVAILKTINETPNEQQIKHLQRIFRGQAAQKLHAHAIKQLVSSGKIAKNDESAFGISGIMTIHAATKAIDALEQGDNNPSLQKFLSSEAHEMVGEGFRAQFAVVASGMEGLTKIATVEQPIPVDVYSFSRTE